MPSNYATFSALNPVDLFKQNRALLPQYNTKFQADFPFTETLRRWQIPAFRPYGQKWQTNDVISLQILSNVAPLNALIVTQSGARRRLFGFTKKQADRSGSGLFIYEVAMALTGLEDAFYKILVTVGDPVLEVWETDWLDIRAYQPDTMLVEYSDSDQSLFYGEAFFATGWSPSFRVEAYFKLKQPYSQDVVYVDQVYNQRLMSSEPYDVESLFIGPASGVPDWVVKKLNWIMGCDTVYYDGQQYTKGDGTQGAASKWEEISVDSNYAFRGWTIDLYPAQRRSSKTFDLSGAIGAKKVLVALNVETAGFADTTLGTASNVITITKAE